MLHDATFNHNYSYDAESRIAQVDSGATAYTYNAEDNRVRKDVSGAASNEYFYFGGNIIAELNPSTGAETNYIFFNGERAARRDPSGTVEYYFSDHLKTTDIVTDAQGNIKNESDFYPWGGELQLTANDPNNHYKFTGKERDNETGLDYFGARYYSNGLGRFITADPLLNSGHPRNPQSWNRYTYVSNNPLASIDPNGLYELNNTCKGDDKRCNKKFRANGDKLKNGLKSLSDKLKDVKDPVQKARLEAALKAMGTEGDHNDVSVSFGTTKGGGSGETEPAYNQQTGKETYNVTLDPSKLDNENAYAIAGAHEGTHVNDIANFLSNPSWHPELSNFSLEYRGYQTSIFAASALGESSLSSKYDGKTYELWNGSWGQVDKSITNFVTRFHDQNGKLDHPETKPHSPWQYDAP